MLTALLAAPARADSPSPGAPGLGDRLYPTLGNGGYDALHYDLDLRYLKAVPSSPVDGTVTMVAKATQSLSRFDLDFAGKSVGGVSVNGQSATFRRVGEDIVITPRKPIRNGDTFLVSTRYAAVPSEANGDDPVTTAFFHHTVGTATAGQPNLAHYFLPSNDHPSDKATFDIRFDVPAGKTAVANGVKVVSWTDRGRSHFVYLMRQPMATELIQLAVGDLDVTNLGVHAGVFLRDVTARPITARINPLPDVTPDQMAWMQQRVGRYPFDLYGSLVEADLGFALETQTLELIDTSWFDEFTQDVWDPTLLHEMSHMWFCDSVAPRTWSDLWLNDGHASWYEFTWAEERGFLEGNTEGYPGRHRLRHVGRADEGGVRTRRPVAPRRRSGRSSGVRATSTRCSRSSATTAARWCCTRSARSWERRRSSASSASGSRATRASPRAPTTSSPWRRRSPAGI